MRVAFLAKRHSVHTTRWVNALAAAGLEMHLISSVHHGEPLDPAVRFHPLPVPPPAGFLLNTPALRRILRRVDPDVLNTHYASGYGTLARLSGFHPHVLSIWGSDVYEFPGRSPVHRALLRGNLAAADWVCSTSHAMARHAATIHRPARLSVIPFGVDTAAFRPGPRDRDRTDIVVGTVKALAPRYGVDLLLHAFARMRDRLASEDPGLAARLRLRIVGGGPAAETLARLAHSLGVAEVVDFVGPVPHDRVPAELRGFDVYAALSRHESFGVAVIEASACGIPVLVSDAGGLPEVVVHDRTGMVVPSEDVGAAADALHRLVLNPALRSELGSEGRTHVMSHYAWEASVRGLGEVYLAAAALRSAARAQEGVSVP